MSFNAPAFVTVNPSFIEPELIMQYSQASGAFDLLSSGGPLVRIGENDQFVYVKKLQLTTQSQSSQSTSNQLPGVSIVSSQASTAAYRLQLRTEYGMYDTSAAGVWGVSLPEAYRLAARQAIAQRLRNMLLYGNNPSLNEGLLNTVDATRQNLGADSNGNIGYSNWDSGQLAQYLLNIIGSIKTRILAMGVPLKFKVLAPQRFLQQISYNGIVSLTQFQRIGAGVDVAAGLVKSVAGWQGDDIEWFADDTLIGQGPGGSDAILFLTPELKLLTVNATYNTNAFANLTPGMQSTTLMYVDMAAPTEVPTPIADGGITTMYTLRATSGWSVRPEALTILGAQYS